MRNIGREIRGVGIRGGGWLTVLGLTVSRRMLQAGRKYPGVTAPVWHISIKLLCLGHDTRCCLTGLHSAGVTHALQCLCRPLLLLAAYATAGLMCCLQAVRQEGLKEGVTEAAQGRGMST